MRHVSGPKARPVEHAEHLTSMLWQRADEEERVARHHDGHRWVDVSWRQLAEWVRLVAAGLVASGIEPGERVAIMSTTRLEWTVADLAILATGAVTVPLYDTDSADQCAWVCSDSGVRLALAETREHADRLDAVREDAPTLGEVLVISEGGLDALADRGGANHHDEVRRRLAGLDGDRIASIVYTSGTTGRPKGCALAHRNLLWTTRQATDSVRPLFEMAEASTLLFLPLAHIFTRVIEFACLERGVTLGYARSMEHLEDDIATFRPTFLLSVPRVFEKIHNDIRRQATGARRKVFDFADQTARQIDTSDEPPVRMKAKAKVADTLVYGKVREALGGRIRYCLSGGAPLDDDLAHFFNAAGITILQGYGLTETSAAVTVDRVEDARVGTVGPPLPGVEVRIEDDGEILARGSNIFPGYQGNEDATREVLDEDGWFRTEDLGTLDEDGHLRITGRKKDIIVTAGGKNVSPEPLEEKIKAHPLVSQSVLIGDERPFVSALVALDADELRSFADEHGIARDPEALREYPAVRSEIHRAIEQANSMVSRAESVREFRILPRELSLEEGELTPTMKPRRPVIAEHFGRELADIYSRSR